MTVFDIGYLGSWQADDSCTVIRREMVFDDVWGQQGVDGEGRKERSAKARRRAW